MNRRIIQVFLACLCLASGRLVAQVGVPVGVYSVHLDAGETLGLSCPFLTVDNHLPVTVRFENPALEAADSLKILRWDVAEQEYADISGLRWLPAGEAGVLHLGGQLANADAAAFLPGGGFWIENRGEAPCDVFLHGEIVLDHTTQMVFGPGLTLFGYPYSTGAKLSETAFTVLAATSTGQLALGSAVWADIEGEVVSIDEARPYDSLFEAGVPPRVTEVSPGGSGNEAEYFLEVTGVEGELLDVFAQDLLAEDDLDTQKGWQLVAEYLPTHGRQSFEWADEARDLTELNSARVVVFARADIDSDGDGLPDGRELLLFGTNPSVPDHPTSADTRAAATPASIAEDRPSDPAESGRRNGRVIHVDRVHGDDECDGLSQLRGTGVVGPKRTIRAGLRACPDGGTMVVHPGTYREQVSLCGRDIKVCIEGDVSFCN